MSRTRRRAARSSSTLYVDAIPHPEEAVEKVDGVIARIRERAEAAKESVSVLGSSEDLSPGEAQRLRAHPLPHWVERMTVSYLQSNGGEAVRRGTVWDPVWPDGQTDSNVVFTINDLEETPTAWHLTLDDLRVRGLATRLMAGMAMSIPIQRHLNSCATSGVISPPQKGAKTTSSHRELDANEFRGFALSDSHAPLIFVNGADAKSAHMFTLAHELAHLWLGDAGEGLSGFKGLQPGDGEIERSCDRAAAEFLVPAAEIQAVWRGAAGGEAPSESLARRFKVSPVVFGRRAMDLGLMERSEFFRFYRDYTRSERRKKQTATGSGDFCNNQNNRVGHLFASHLIRAAKEGRVGFKEAYDLTGLHAGTFQRYARKLELTLP